MNKPPKNKRLIKMGAITYAQLVKLLMDGDMTCHELAEETGLHYVTVLQYTRELYRIGVLHICRWHGQKRVYKVGSRKDAVRVTLTPAERSKLWRQRQQAKQQTSFLYGAKHANQTARS